jgi:hypothetical protein
LQKRAAEWFPPKENHLLAHLDGKSCRERARPLPIPGGDIPESDYFMLPWANDCIRKKKLKFLKGVPLDSDDPL